MSQQPANANNLQLPGQESSSASPQVQAQNQQTQVPTQTLAQNQVRGGVQAARGGKKPTRGRGRGTMTVTPPMYGNLTPPPQMLQQLQIHQQMPFQPMQPSQQFPRGQQYYPPQITLQPGHFQLMQQQQLPRQPFIAPQPQANQQAMSSQNQQPVSLQQRSDHLSKQIRNIRQSLESTDIAADAKQHFLSELSVKTKEFNEVQEQLRQQNRNTTTTGQKIEQKQQQTSQIMSPAASTGQILAQKGSVVQKSGLIQKPQTIAASPLTPNLTPGQAAVDFDMENGSKGQLLKSRKIQELVAEIDPNERVHPDVEQILLEVADQFIASVAEGAVLNALHRGSNTLEVKDIQLFLEKNYNIRIPGFASDEIRSVRKTNILANHATKLQAINQQKSAPPHSTTNITPPVGQPPKPVAKKRPREEPTQDTSKQKKLQPNK